MDKFISPTEAQEILFAIQKKSPALLHTSFQIPFVSDTTLSKAEMAQLVVSAF
ncbi:MAG: hypothetical protein LBP53_07490 [Candidatus Peribacteria bacterium]|nr:hypothetical protein [Candidatus Peribacteria bacterium]